jgi:hypothetical protein
MKAKTSPRPQAIQTSRHFRVSHHRHTLHVTPHRTTSYPTLFMIVLCVGVFLASWTRFVTADVITQSASYTVGLSVPGPAPTVAATIDTPSEGATFTDLPIDLGGTCPLNTYVTLYRNGAFSGVSICDAGGKWSLQTGLFEGANELQARVFSQTDVPGPMSASVNVYYNPPVPPAPQPGEPIEPAANQPNRSSTGQSTGGGSSTVTPLLFKTTYSYKGHYTGTQTTWQLTLEGGVPPYAISVDWGDGTRDLISRSQPGAFSLKHTYYKRGEYKGHYVIKLTATDAYGTKTFLQLITIVNDPPANGGAGGGISSHLPGAGSGQSPNYLQGIMRYIWPGYAIVLLMLTSFWLGERREYYHLKPRLKRTRHA